MDAETATPRARAAWAYSRLTQTALADLTEQIHEKLNYHRLRAILGDGDTEVGLEELHAIADACGVPRAFMEHGWQLHAGDDGSLEARVEHLAAEVRRLQVKVLDLEDGVVRNATEIAALKQKGRRQRRKGEGS
ncbi:MAG TPA: hypothetical protein VFT41_03245 [Gemmatimonadaceae bacterium]|nr:hypothetical protein [Gemmatimonadaceae bacterium]